MKYTREQVQAMVDRTYGLALNKAAARGIVQPWQNYIPSVETLRDDLIAASTWPGKIPKEN